MAFIGHELQHAIEILSNPHVRNTEDLYLFYSRFGTRGNGGLDFETTAAIKTGNAVREEIRAFQSCMEGKAYRIATLRCDPRPRHRIDEDDDPHDGS